MVLMNNKIIIYQVLPRLFGNRVTTRKRFGAIAENGCGKFSNFDEHTLRGIHDMGFSHIWYTGVIRHATQTDYSLYGIPSQHAEIVKGKAGSPYAITDYYDVDPDLALCVEHRMEEWLSLIERTHREGMKVIIDFVPNHVAREYHSICKPKGVRDLGEDDNPNMNFSTDNNFYYCWGMPLDLSDVDVDNVSYHESPAKATGNDRFTNRPGRNDWYETVKLNYGIDYCDAGGRSYHFDPIPDTWKKMTDILLFWAEKGVDGFRCDMAEMVPSAFWDYATKKVRKEYPHIIFIGEVYDTNQYRTYVSSGFDYLYDKVGMYDCVKDVIRGERPASSITNEWQSTDDIRDHMLYFLENHDELRIASEFFAGDGEKAIPGVLVSALLRGNPFMIYSGQEFGERGMDEEGFSGCDGRTTIFDYWSPRTLTKAYSDDCDMSEKERLLNFAYHKILHIATTEKAIGQGECFDLMYVNPLTENFNPRYHFAFLRKKNDEVLLIVSNFSGNPADVKVMIPGHAFDYLDIPEKSVKAVDLLTEESVLVDLKRDGFFPMHLEPYSGRVYKFRTKDGK